MPAKKKVFISYKRNVEPDEQVALDIFAQLGREHDVFIDLKMMVGTKWKKEIKQNLLEADCFISLISESSVKSDMVTTEIQMAYKQARITGKPIILPVRLNYFEDLEYDLTAYLDSSNYIAWKSYSDTENTIQQLRQAIAGQTPSEEKALGILRQRVLEKENRIKTLLSNWEFTKAFEECSEYLEQNPDAPSFNILAVIALLKGEGADTYQTKTIKRVEKYLENACKTEELKPTALLIWGLIKYDHYVINGLYEGELSFDDIKDDLQNTNLKGVDINLLNMIKASRSACDALGLPQLVKHRL